MIRDEFVVFRFDLKNQFLLSTNWKFPGFGQISGSPFRARVFSHSWLMS